MNCRLENIDEFEFIHRPYHASRNKNNDAFVYLCHLHTAKQVQEFENIIAVPDRLTEESVNQMLDNIFALERGVGDAATAERFLRTVVFQNKVRFYKHYNRQAVERLENYFFSYITTIL